MENVLFVMGASKEKPGLHPIPRSDSCKYIDK
jgi:hypothetical protein